MKNNLLWIWIVFLCIGCLDDKSNYNYKDINDFEDWQNVGVKNVQSSYTLYPGESVTLEPKVRFSIDTLNPDATYAWYIEKDKKLTKVCDQLFYTHEATTIGDYRLVLTAIDNKTGVTFSEDIDIDVVSPWKNGWMVLSKGGSGESQLSMILSKKQSKFVVDVETGKEKGVDTVVYVGQDINIVPNLGRGPRKLVENFIYEECYNSDIEDEVMVLQESGPVELEGNHLTLVGMARDEFFDGVPANFDPVNAALTWGGKWLLGSDNYVYGATMSVASDLHSGRYLKEPIFNGKKIKQLLPYWKASSYGNIAVIGIDENNTFFGIVDQCNIKDAHGNDFTIVAGGNYTGSLMELGSIKGADESLFKNIDGEYIFHAWVDQPYQSGSYLSVLKRGNAYYWHYYTFKFDGYRYKPGMKMIASESKSGPLDVSVMNGHQALGVLPWKKILMIASNNTLYGFSYEKDDPVFVQMLDAPNYRSEIVDIAVKDYDRDTHNAHLAVALKSGEIYVYEVKYDKKEGTVELLEIYHKDGFGEIVDLEYKFGSGTRPGASYLY
ncbi:PKD-like family lipoprotein [Gabonibacter massiliensis]|uniref:PKD-like family lipoprotein n=1 Tax=Gabonibacter massiliensis TaxID=1720195 RepID=UPI00073F846D|nr:PKD-like family lipoprotein [Gabonibacter massiliensis]